MSTELEAVLGSSEMSLVLGGSSPRVFIDLVLDALCSLCHLSRWLARQEQEERRISSTDTEEKGLKHPGFILPA